MVARLEMPPHGQPEERLRHKLSRWNLPGYPRIVAARVLARLQGLRNCVAPRVHVAVLSTLFNRWATGRRFQRRDLSGCMLGCGGEDSVEHYLRCNIGRDFAARRLGLFIAPEDAWSVLMLAAGRDQISDDPALLIRIALFHYTLYRATNALRHAAPAAPDTVRRVLQQSLIEGVRGHQRSRRELARVFAR